jgi:PAS domain-containing protein
MLPARRGYDEAAQTGRGLEMVELLADDFGMQPVDGDGKRVWFRLGPAPADVRDSEQPAPGPQLVGVRLVNLPVTLYSAWQEHADAILREAMLVALDAADGELPEDYALASEALSALGAQTTDVFALDGSIEHIDVTIELSRTAIPNFPVLRDVLRRCSELSAEGLLLVPPSLPEIQAVRRWVCDEVGRQGQGLPPRPFADMAVEDVPVDPMSADAIDAVRSSGLAQIAADRWNRIIAVSPAAAELLGWTADELEAHVAAFTRQMLGGEPRILGRPTDVPALRRDGGEVPVTLLIERRFDSRDRSLFVATLTPR